jgi:hypothetical protein
MKVTKSLAADVGKGETVLRINHEEVQENTHPKAMFEGSFRRNESVPIGVSPWILAMNLKPRVKQIVQVWAHNERFCSFLCNTCTAAARNCAKEMRCVGNDSASDVRGTTHFIHCKPFSLPRSAHAADICDL